MKNRLFQKSKRLLSGIVATAIAASMLPTFPAIAETSVKYPYTLFAGSIEEGAITVNAGNFCVNGNVATNGTIVSSGNMNINGTKNENANESMIFIFDKIDSQYFSTSNIDKFTEDYTLEEINININTPTEVMGEITLTGNININTALKSLEDVNLYGEVKNTNDSVIFSKYGDIIIDSQNVNLNGLVYAPFGDVEITAQNLNLNNVVIIADTITFSCPNVNANYSGNAAEFISTVSEPLDIPVDEWQYMKDENENGSPDFFEEKDNWILFKDNNNNEVPDCIEGYIDIEENGLLQYSYSDFNIGFSTGDTETSVTQNLYLPTNEYDGVKISWTSNKNQIIQPDGTVLRPSSGSEDVILTANIIHDNGKTEKKDFYLRVFGYPTYNISELNDYTIDDINNLNPNDDIEYQLNEFGNIQSYYGKYSEIIINTVEDAINSFYNVKSLTGIKDPIKELHPKSTITNQYGSIYKFEQYYNGIPVYDSIFTVVSNSYGETTFLLSDYTPIASNISTTPYFTQSQAKEIVKNTFANFNINDINTIEDLYIYGDENGTHLVWRIAFTLTNNINSVPDGKYQVLIDANTGNILYAEPLEKNDQANLSINNDLEGISRTFTNTAHISIFEFNNYLMLKDKRRNIHIGQPHITDVIINHGLEDDWKPEEVSAMFNTEKTYDYYYDNFGRDSYDNKGGKIQIWLDPSIPNNSSYTRKGVICLGKNTDSNRHLGSCARGLDTIGHEFTHGVVSEETNLIYAGTGGAIDEGYADIFGNYIDAINYNGVPDWSHGNHHMLSGIGFRDLANPNNSNNPAKYGDIYFKDYKKDKKDHYGVHTNGSILTRAAYLMENGDSALGINAISSPNLVKDIWYYSLCYGYTSKTDFYDVRLNVIKAATNLGLSSSDINIINDVFDEVNITKISSDEGNSYFKNNWKFWLNSIFGEISDFSNFLSGKVVVADADHIVSNNIGLSNVKVEIKEFTNSAFSINTLTSQDGNYSASDFYYSDVKIEYSKAGYLPEIQYITDSFDTNLIYCNDVELIPNEYSGIGTAIGTIKDATTANGVGGLTLCFRKGINNKSYSSTNGMVTTDEYGNYNISLEAGNYCVEVIDNRYLLNDTDKYSTTYFNIKILGNKTITNQNGIVSDKLSDNQIRIVLSWGETPEDLDSHLYGETIDNNSFHVYYKNKSYSYNDKTIAYLDIDDTLSYGPETTTLYDPINGIYTFNVYNYSGFPSITTSNAKVQIYVGNSNIPIYTFNVPSNGDGNTWNVFKYQSSTKTIVPVNTIT